MGNDLWIELSDISFNTYYFRINPYALRTLKLHLAGQIHFQNTMDDKKQRMKDYWRRNIKILFALLAIWFLVSFGFGILLVEPLNAIRIGGFKLGFWFAQQGSIFTFVVLIFVYVYKMNKLDEEFDVNEK